jgi:hypothetical protein
MLVFSAALWCVLAAAARSALARVGTGPDGGAPIYDPGAAAAAAASSSSAGATDIWGLGDKADSRILLGVNQPPLGADRRGGDAVLVANGVQPPAGGYGPQTKSALEAMQELPKLYATNKAGYIALQQRLYSAGFFGSASPQAIGIGSYNQQTVNAYRSAVLAAVQLGDSGTPMTFDELLDQKDPSAAARAKKPIQPGFISEFSDPATVAAIAQQSAQQALGRNLTTEEVKSFVAEFHQQEQRFNNNRKAAAQTAATGADASTEGAPSAQAAADQYVQQGGRGVEATGNRLADFAGILEGMVRGGA